MHAIFNICTPHAHLNGYTSALCTCVVCFCEWYVSWSVDQSAGVRFVGRTATR